MMDNDNSTSICCGPGAGFRRGHAIEEAMAIYGQYLGMKLRGENPESERQCCLEILMAMFEATSGSIVPAWLVYPYSLKKANDRMETSCYHASRGMDRGCARDIDRAINAGNHSVDNYGLGLAAIATVSRHGFDRMNAVLAHHIREHRGDGHYSAANREWAQGIISPDMGHTSLGSNGALVDGFATHARRLYADSGAERFALPGQEERGESVHGYEIVRSVMVGTDNGLAIAHNPDAVSRFVCWQFIVDNGKRDYYWGIYGEEQDAVDGYNVRLFAALH
jgi:hypothetical protein